MTDLPYLSFSKLSTYSHCGRQFELRYIDKVPQAPQGALIGGRVVHSCIAEAEQDKWWREEDGAKLAKDAFLDLFDKALKAEESPIRWGGRKTKEYDAGEDDRWWRVQGPVMLKRYLRIRADCEDQGAIPVESGIEMEVLAHLSDGQLIKGFIDALLLVTADGDRAIFDWKTGRPGGGDPLQLASYAWALGKGPNIACDTGAFVYLRRGDQSYHDLRPLVPLIERQYADLARGVEAGIFPLRPSAMCKGCSVKDYCEYGRILEPGGEG